MPTFGLKLFRLLSPLFIASISFCQVACRKGHPAPKKTLSAATYNGANTFSCLIDGEVFIASGVPLRGWSGEGVLAYSTPYNFHISADDGVGDFWITFDYFSKPQVPGSFTLSTSNHSGAGYSSDNYYKSFSTNATSPGLITVTHYMPEEYISGTFSFDAITGDSVTVHVTMGRFDVEL